MDERKQAVLIANRWLEHPSDMMGDPDDDESIIARQFLRAHERLDQLGEYGKTDGHAATAEELKPKLPLTIDEVLLRLHRVCTAAGTQRAWAKKVGVSEAYLSDVMLKRREPRPAILEPLGLYAETVYRETQIAPREQFRKKRAGT